MLTGLGAVLEVFDPSVRIGLAIVCGLTLLAGLIAWAGERTSPEPPGPAPSPEYVPPRQVPPALAHFTGRTEILAELDKVFAANRPKRRGRAAAGTSLVVTLHGPAGVGKSALATRFAHEIADSYPDGQLYVDLRGSAEDRVQPEDVLTGFLLALGVRLTTDPGGLGELQKLWWTWVSGKRLLIYLDNAVDDHQVSALLPSEPGCAVIVTSRQPLYVQTTYDKRLSEFSESQGVALLAQLARDDRVADDLEAAESIVRLCGHLPLAIGICGGRLAARGHWTLRELADRLGDERRTRLDELEITNRIDMSVRASLQLSYDEATEMQRRLLRSLGVLALPDVPDWAAGALLGVSELEGADQLDALVDAQLVEYSSADRTPTRRFRLHELVRLYAKERADREDSPETSEAAVARVIDGYRERAESVAAARWPQDWHRKGGGGRTGEPAAMNWLRSERLALLACVDQAAKLQMWSLTWRLGRAFCSLCHSLRIFWSDWREVAEITHEAAVQLGDQRSIGIALLERAAVVGGLGQLEHARSDAEEALRIFRELRENWWAGRALRTVGKSLRDAGNLDSAQQYLLDAITAFKEAGDDWWHARAQRNLADLRLSQRRYDEALELLEQAQKVFQRDGNRYSNAQTQRVLGEVLAAQAQALRAQGAHAKADSISIRAGLMLERSAEMFRTRGEQWEEARCLRAAGDVGAPGNGLRELAFVRRARTMLERQGDSWGVARAMIAEGTALTRLDRIDEAVDVLRDAVASFRDLGDRWWQARSLRTLAEALLASDQQTDAREHAEEALDIYRSLGHQAGVNRAQEVLARTVGTSSDQ
ncbi:ATP-binding protein [Actinopolymorpha pittospori]